MKSFVFLILTFLCLSFSVYCQNSPYSLLITVNDQLNKKITNAQIILLRAGKAIKTVNTNKQGTVIFGKLPSGEYSFITKAKGFKEFTSEIILLDSVLIKTVEINLEIAPRILNLK